MDVAFAVIAVRLVVSLGMWRWNAWDAAERQWFRGARTRPSSRVAIYVIAVLLGLLVVAVVAALGGLEGPLRASGAPFVEYLTPAAVVGGVDPRPRADRPRRLDRGVRARLSDVPLAGAIARVILRPCDSEPR